MGKYIFLTNGKYFINKNKKLQNFAIFCDIINKNWVLLT